MSPGRAVLTSALAVCALTAACGTSTPASDGAATTATTSAVAPAVAGSASAASALPRVVSHLPKHVSKLAVVVLENHSRAEALGQMPFLASQATKYGEATHWYAMRHPSLPNYLELAGGSTFGVSDDAVPAAHQLVSQSVFGQLAAHGRSVRTYAEDEPTNCSTTSSGRYAVKHNPWAYFASPLERAACRRYDVPLGSTTSGTLHRDIAGGRLPTYSMIIPNLCHDAHDCGLTAADAWLRTWVGQIEGGTDFRTGRLALVVTFDEDDRHAGNQVATVVMAEQLHHRVVSTRLTHASLAAAPSRLVGLPPLRGGAGSPDVLAAFGLR